MAKKPPSGGGSSVAQEHQAKAISFIAKDFRNADLSKGIIYQDSDLTGMAVLGEAAVMNRPDAPIIFQRGGGLVRLARLPGVTVRSIKKPDGALAIVAQTPDAHRALLTESATWLRSDKRENKLKPVACPDLVVRTSMSRAGQWAFPVLRAVCEAPTIRQDGTILQTPGYDQATGIYFDPGVASFPTVPDAPRKAEINQARTVFADMVCDFAFADLADLSVLLAAILTAIVRTSLPTAPLFGFTAPSMGTGKTAAAQIVALISTGRAAAVAQHAADAAEEQKFLLSVLFEGFSVVLIDNVERTLKSAALCSLLTSESFAGRLLGKTGMISVPSCATFLVTGNNLTVAGDLTSRTLICRMDPKVENPSERTFERDIYAWVLDKRPRLVWAGLVLLKAYLASGNNVDNKLRPWNRFPQWSSLVRAALVWSGYADPCESIRRLEAEDPDRIQLQAVLMAWRQAFGDSPKRVKELIDQTVMGNDHDLRESLLAVAGDHGDINGRSLGWWIARHADRIHGGYCLKRVGAKSGQVLWNVVEA